MRNSVHIQRPLVPPSIDHEHARELTAMSARLDGLSESSELVWADLTRGLKKPGKGRKGLTAETVLRALLLKQLRSLTYDSLAFHLADSQTYRSFCLIGLGQASPSASALQRDIKKLRPETLEQLNHLLLGVAAEEGIEEGRKIRVDCTVTETNIHEPRDSEQLWDCVRVLIRGLKRGQKFVDIDFTDHTLRAKRRRMAVLNAKNKKVRRKAYIDLLKVTRKTVAAAERGVEKLQAYVGNDIIEMVKAQGIQEELTNFIELSKRVIDQTHRRVILEEKVPAQEKVLSIFEPHTDIIIKKNRTVDYGHKICLTTGASGLIMDLVTEDGNPADSTLAVRMVERQKNIYGRVPRQSAFDGGFASKDNLAKLKEAGVEDVCFSKRRGLTVLDMVKSSWVYRQLQNFRAGIEAGISLLKRCFGLGRCTWRGLDSFKAYTWSSVLSANLLTLARHDLA